MAALIAKQFSVHTKGIMEAIDASERRQETKGRAIEEYVKSLEQKLDMISGGAGMESGTTTESRTSRRMPEVHDWE